MAEVWASRLTNLPKTHNAHLYITFKSCVPRSILKGFIATELRRHLLRCTSELDLVDNYAAFYKRLRSRGYPARFLRQCFDRRPAFESRQALLYCESTSPTAVSGPSVLVLTYGTCGVELLKGALLDAYRFLPPHLTQQRKLTAWRKGSKISDLTSVPGR